METVELTHTETEATAAVDNSTLWENLEWHRFSVICGVMAVVAIIGGIAAAMGISASVAQMAIVAFPTMVSLSLILAVQPMKRIIYSGAIALFVDLVIIAINLF